ncbi:radical SAM protein, partial [bacterium]|nr:radical SAM protein [bacterium]
MARKLTKPPCLVAGDGNGQVFEIPELQAAGRRLHTLLQPEPGDYLPMPNGSSLFELPGRKPVGFDPVKKIFTTVAAYRGVPVTAVAAFLAPAYTQMLHAAFVTEPGAVRLPLFAYTAVGWRRNQFYVPAIRVDADVRQDPEQFDQRLIHRRANALLKKHPRNRLVA